jgi:uncharacterized membrane protein YidH (DUF202 family)
MTFFGNDEFPVGFHPIAMIRHPIHILAVPHRRALNKHHEKPTGVKSMTAKTIVAVFLITIGVVVLAYSGITFTTPGETIRFLGLRVETTESHFIPPVVGAFALVGGIVLLLVKSKGRA